MKKKPGKAYPLNQNKPRVRKALFFLSPKIEMKYDKRWDFDALPQEAQTGLLQSRYYVAQIGNEKVIYYNSSLFKINERTGELERA